MKSKRFLSALCITAMFATLSACGNSTENSSAESTKSENSVSEPVESEKAESSEDSAEESSAEKQESSAENAEGSSAAEEDPDTAWESTVEKDIADTLAALDAEYDQLKNELNTYEAYAQNPDKMEAFYDRVREVNQELGIKMCEYGIAYAEDVVNSEKSFDDKYDALENIYDVLYDDAGDDIYDGIYDGILEDMYDDFYDGLLEDAYDTTPYDAWYGKRSNEYDWWSDARSDVYDDWTDFRSDIYDFWSDVRGEMWSNDTERAAKKIEKFRGKVEKMKGESKIETTED